MSQTAKNLNRTYHQAQSQMEYLPNYYKWSYHSFMPYIAGDIIELGAGAGIGIKQYLEQVNKIYVIDHDEKLLSKLEQNITSPKIKTVCMDLNESWSKLENTQVDNIIMMDVLEHFQDDFSFLKKTLSHLKPNGHVLIKVPHSNKDFCEIDKASGHFRRYDKEHMIKLAKILNLELLSIKSINPLGLLAYKLKKDQKTNFSRSFSATQLKIINSLIPVIKQFDHLNFLPGLSLCAVFKKHK
ncbi:hypothetical protein BVY03_00325 [bacterium K02(2017)]|nr:hypothetical protein BVY03_00325 [bacterium K02(2017)]